MVVPDIAPKTVLQKVSYVHVIELRHLQQLAYKQIKGLVIHLPVLRT